MTTTFDLAATAAYQDPSAAATAPRPVSVPTIFRPASTAAHQPATAAFQPATAAAYRPSATATLYRPEAPATVLRPAAAGTPGAPAAPAQAQGAIGLSAWSESPLGD